MTDPDTESDFSFPKSSRLLTSSEFSRVFDNAGIKVPHPDFIILARINQLGYPRMGLVIAKKNVRLAVNRNKIKRLIRESFRLKQHNLPAIDAIVLARRNSDKKDNKALLDTLDLLWKRVVQRAGG